MNDITTTTSMQNVDSPFTELFSLLVKYDVSNSKKVKLAYSPSALRSIRQHGDNAIQMILQGLHGYGVALANANNNDLSSNNFRNMGHLISLLSNLVEALYKLCGDLE